MEQSCSRPGFYYVSAVMDKRFWRLLGPFSNHTLALEQVEAVRRKVCEINCLFDFAAFGTCRDDDDGECAPCVGAINDLFPELSLPTKIKIPIDVV